MPPSRPRPASNPQRGRGNPSHGNSWDDEGGSAESADERIKRLEMQIASGQHGTVDSRASRSAKGSGRSRGIGEKLLLTTVFIGLAAVAVAVVKLVIQDKRPPVRLTPATSPTASTDLGPVTGDTGGATAASPGADHWIESGSERGQRATAFVSKFLAADGPEEKRPMFRQTGDLDALLAKYAEHPLMKALGEQRFAERFFWDGNYVAVDVNISGFGFRPVVMELVEGGDGFLVDIAAFFADVDYDWDDLPGVIRENGPVDLRVFIMIDALLQSENLGDVVVQIRNPNFPTGHNALLSHLDTGQQHIVQWLNAKVPLPFVVRIKLDETAGDDTLRVENMTASSWFIPSNDDEAFEIRP